MKNYYILSVDSFQDTFTRIDAGKDFYFELSVQNITGILSVLQGGDTVIVYRKSPVSGCTIVLQVVENAGNKTKFAIIVGTALPICIYVLRYAPQNK